MRTAITAFVATTVLFCAAVAAIASLDPDPDGLAVSFTPDANTVVTQSPPFMPFAIYVVLINPTFPQLHGWEAAIREADTSTLFLLSSSIPEGGVNVGTGMQFSVAYDVPRVTSSATVLATMQVMVRSMPSVCLLLTGIDQPAIPVEGPLFWIEPGHPTEARVSSPFYNSVAAVINEGNAMPESPPSRCSFVVSVESPTWGALKSLYR